MTVRRRGISLGGETSDACVVVSSQPVPVVRFELADRSLSYLTTELRHWELAHVGSGERLYVRAGAEGIVITGQNLLPIRQALDLLRLQIVRLFVGRKAFASGPIVEAIEIERIRPARAAPLLLD